MKTLFLIPARGGSKGLPDKNIKSLGGKPLIEYTIGEALKCTNVENICVSTEDANIQEISKQAGLNIHFTRPHELATDTASSEDVIKHAITYFENIGVFYDYIVLLQPTSPLRKEKHIKEALALVNPGIEAIISVTEAKVNPYYLLFTENKHGELIKFAEGNYARRQDCPTVWEINGAIYIFSVDSLKKKGLSNLIKTKYVMDKQSSIDIDDELDFMFAECMLKRNLE